MSTTHPLNCLSFHWVTLCPGCLTEFRCSPPNSRVILLIFTLSQDSFPVDLLWAKKRGNLKNTYMYYWNLHDLVPVIASLQRWSSMSHDLRIPTFVLFPPTLNPGGCSVKQLSMLQGESWETFWLWCLGIFILRTLPLESRRHSVECPGHVERPCTSTLELQLGCCMIWHHVSELFGYNERSRIFRWLLSTGLTSCCNHMWVPKKNPPVKPGQPTEPWET